MSVAIRSGRRSEAIASGRRSLTARAEEKLVRQELARELHDTVVQLLTAVLVQMRLVRKQHGDHDRMVNDLDRLESMLGAAVRNLRTVLLDLRDQPTVVHSFHETVDAVLSDFTERTGIETRLIESPAWPACISGVAAYNLVRILEEALANVRAHSGASRVEVELGACADDRLVFRVRDDGHCRSRYSPVKQGLGVIGMFERAAVLGGELTVSSTDTSGTTVVANFEREAVQWAL